jgi:hypothetical protein
METDRTALNHNKVPPLAHFKKAIRWSPASKKRKFNALP